jgi:hypothetical protein
MINKPGREFIEYYVVVMKVLMHISETPSPHAYVLPKDNICLGCLLIGTLENHSGHWLPSF